jgi:hypothetical protein
MLRQSNDGRKQLLCLFNLSDETLYYVTPPVLSEWRKILDSKEPKWREGKNAVGNKLHPILISAFERQYILPWSITVYSQVG